MKKQENMKKYYDIIIDLKGIDEFKEMLNRLHNFYIKNDALPDIKLRNYLLISKRGGGITTLVKTFAEYLNAAKAIEFCGTVKSFEFKLEYIAPELYFSELTRLNNAISGFAGYNRFYKGIICININEWLDHIGESHFMKFLNYISSNNDKLLAIFCIHSDTKNKLEAVESVLASHLRIDSLTLRFPDENELVELMESQYIQDKGFSFTEDAKTLLSETIKEIASENQFNGFKSIVQLSNDILFNIITTDWGGNKHISADMLSCYSKDSNYVKRTKTRIGSELTIGFG